MPEETAAIFPRVAIITGAMPGSGFAAATTCTSGCFCCDRCPNQSRGIAQSLEECGSPVYGGVLDVRDTGSVESFVADVERELGPVDILVNSLALEHSKPSASMMKRSGEVIDTNLNGCFRMIKACMPGHDESEVGPDRESWFDGGA